MRIFKVEVVDSETSQVMAETVIQFDKLNLDPTREYKIVVSQIHLQ